MIQNDLDQETPGHVYLCQVSEEVSCGACCGLYNINDITYHKLEKVLKQRSILFESTARNVSGFFEYESKISSLESQKRPYLDFHHCPYVGLIGDSLKTVGCLLHPLASGNDEVDYRGISYYGGMACKNYFCLTCKKLRPRYKSIVRSILDGWYLYGIIVTEWEMLNCLFSNIEQIIHRDLTVVEIEESNTLKNSLVSFFHLKLETKLAQDYQANYFFEDRNYPLPEINYPQFNRAESKYDAILRCFRFKMTEIQDLEKADSLIETAILQITDIIQNAGKE